MQEKVGKLVVWWCSGVTAFGGVGSGVAVFGGVECPKVGKSIALKVENWCILSAK